MRNNAFYVCFITQLHFQDTQRSTELLHLEKEPLLETENENVDPEIERSKHSFRDNFLEFLNKDPDGKIVLAHFNIHHCFNKEIRGLLTRTIIRKFKDEALRTLTVGQKLQNFLISDKVFIAISNILEQTFPGEIATTYFSPFRSENGYIVQKTGTLWAHYNYLKDVLRKQGILENPKSKKQNPENVPPPVGVDETVAKSLNNLENSFDIASLFDDWKITHNKRKSFLVINKLSVNEYIAKFPCLQTQDAIFILILNFVKFWHLSILKVIQIIRISIFPTPQLKRASFYNL